MALSNATKLANFGSGIGTQGSVLEIDNANERIGLGTNNPQTMVQVGTGITMDGAKITATNIVAGSNITASTFTGDGSGLTNVGMDTSNVVSTATTTGLLNVTTSGTLDKLIVTNDSSVGGALTITGNFTVKGTQTVINTESLEIEDKTIGIGSTSSPTNTTADGAGIVVYGATEKSLKWNNTGTKWTLTGGALETAEINLTGIITAANFKGGGANLTSLNGDNISSGIVTTARLGTGTRNASTFLTGAGTFASAGGGGTEAYFFMGGAGQGLTSATWARVACNTAYQDSVSGCDVSTNNGRYTIQTGHAGRYYFIGQCSTFANGNNITRADVKIYKNGAVWAGAYQHVISGGAGYARHVGPQIATMDNAVVGDYYELWVVVSGTTVSLSMDGQTSKSNYFMGWKIAD